MRLAVRHRAVARCAPPARCLAALLRMTPREDPGVRVLCWRVQARDGRRLAQFLDGFGNRTHLYSPQDRRAEVSIEAQGLVEIYGAAGTQGGHARALPPALFLRATPETAPHQSLASLAAEAAGATDAEAGLGRLAHVVRERIACAPSADRFGTTAAEALRRGAGACSDRVHVFLAAARALGHPARCVSGYLHAGGGEEEPVASHVWAEVWLPGSGWVRFDPSPGSAPTPLWVRTAVGLDCADVAPVRVAPGGAPGEQLRMRVQVEQVAAQ
jgi:transglutaminase-like putative cysteine protease